MSKLVSTNPAKNYEIIGEVDISEPDEINAKVTAAQNAQQAWKELGVSERIKYLQPVCGELERRKDTIAHMITKEVGKPISQSRNEAIGEIEEFQWFLDHAEQAFEIEITHEDDQSLHKIVYEPFGVAAIICPWNFPLGTAIPTIVSNLLAGNTVVFKTSEECPLTGKIIEEVFNSQQLPNGVFSEVCGNGSVGEFLVRDNVNLICFTGSTTVGKKLYAVAAEKFIKAVLEMGGSSPCIVFEDADLEVATEQIMTSRFLNCGQVCEVVKRLIVHSSVKEELIKRLVDALSRYKISDPEDEATDLSSLVAERQQLLVRSQLEASIRAGAKAVFTASLSSSLNGAFVAPTILDNISPDMRVWCEEVYGPELPVMVFQTEQEALNLANDTPYGLGAKVITKDRVLAERMASRIQAGTVEINKGDRWLSCNPFGGRPRTDRWSPRNEGVMPG